VKVFKRLREDIMEKEKERTEAISRRTILKGPAVFLLGATVGRASNAYSSSAAATPTDAAPPLPWPWVKLDPMEAGTRAYRSYLEKKG
jgi:hypothetical protein